MSYTHELGDVEFTIKAENINKAFKATKKYLCDKDYPRIKRATDIDDIFSEFWLNAYRGNDDGDITDIDTIDNGIGEIPEDLFVGIAPFVEPGSFIEFHGDENDHYMVKFHNGQCEIITGKVIYPDSTQLSHDRMDVLLATIVDHECNVRNLDDAVENLLRLGFTDDELVNKYCFNEECVKYARVRIERN